MGEGFCSVLGLEGIIKLGLQNVSDWVQLSLQGTKLPAAPECNSLQLTGNRSQRQVSCTEQC